MFFVHLLYILVQCFFFFDNMPVEAVSQGMVDFTDDQPPAVFSLVKDATRLGNPAKDMEIYLFARAGDTPKAQ